MQYKKEKRIFFLLVNNLNMAKVSSAEITNMVVTIVNKGEEARQKAIRELMDMEINENMTTEKVWEMIETL